MRMTSEKIYSVQILRFVAAVLVVYHHASIAAFSFAGNYGSLGHGAEVLGRTGVDIFFVISGFVIALTAQGLTTVQFVARRARRILPLYIPMAAVYTILAAMVGHLTWRRLLATWLLVPVTDRLTDPLIPVAWTLCFEVMFYAAFALTIWRRWTIWPIAAVFLVSLASRSTPATQFIGNPMVLEFLAGVALAHVPRSRAAIVALPIGAALLIIGCYAVSAPVLSDIEKLQGHGAWLRAIFAGTPAALIVWGAINVRVRESVFTYLGDASYALYLIHYPIVQVMAVITERKYHLPADISIALAIAASVALAWRVHELVEKPLMVWSRSGLPRLLGRTQVA